MNRRLYFFQLHREYSEQLSSFSPPQVQVQPPYMEKVTALHELTKKQLFVLMSEHLSYSQQVSERSHQLKHQTVLRVNTINVGKPGFAADGKRQYTEVVH